MLLHWIYLLVVAIFSASLTAAIISFRKANCEARTLAAILVATMTVEFHQTLGNCLENRLWKALITTAMWIQCLQSLDNLCLTRISYEQGNTSPLRIRLQNGGTNKDDAVSKEPEATTTTSPTTAFGRISWGLSMLWNMRAILTPWSVKNIPPFSENEKELVPTRGKFLIRYFGIIVLASVILDTFAQLPPPDIENAMSRNHQKFFSRISEITIEEFMVRIFAVLGFWVNTACTVSLINSLFAVIHVGLRLQDPVSWPPIFGKISESYSIRQFWGYVQLFVLK
jgi:hypothetical protein